jgi:glyoxylase-like metal-dependent hydrolase (beta-lactamase superfamily II)
VAHLILSHLHLDHAGCVEAFARAKVYVSKREFDGVASLLLGGGLAGSSYVEEDLRAWTHSRIDWRLIDAEYEIVDFLPGVKFVALGSGHAFGILALLVFLDNYGPVLICSDAIYGSVNAGPPPIPPGVIMDEAGWYKSFDYLMRTAKEYGAEIWYGHDLEQSRKLRAVEGGCYV